MVNLNTKFLKKILSKEVIFLLASCFFFNLSFGINIVTLPAILTYFGLNSAYVGTSFAFEVSGGIIAAFFLSRFISRFSIIKSLQFFASIYASAILIIYFYQNFFLWLIIIFLMGFFWFSYTVTSHAWLNILLKNENRGIILAIFSLTASVALAPGPILVSFIGSINYLSFVTSAIFTIFSFIFLIPIKKSSKLDISSKKIRLFEFIKNNPQCAFARFFLDFQVFAILTLTVVFGIKLGFSAEISGILISAFLFSGIADIFVGFLLKKFNPYKFIITGFIGTLLSFLMIFFFHKSYIFLLILYFIFGIFIAMIYVSVYKITNEDYKKEKLVAANATFQLIGTFGSIFGALLGGLLIKIFGVYGLPATIILGSSSYLIFLQIYKCKFNKY